MAAGRWFEYPCDEQMANIGSDVYRAIKQYKENNLKRFSVYYDMALELFDLTIKDKRWEEKSDEVIQMRERFSKLFSDSDSFKNLDEEFELVDNYFLQYAMSVSLKKGR